MPPAACRDERMDRSARSCPVPFLSMEILGRKKILVDACSRPESWWFGGARVGRHEGSDYAAPLATSVCLRLAATLFDVQQDDVRIPETATTRWRPKACIHFQQTPSAASGFGEESRAMVRVREVTRLAPSLRQCPPPALASPLRTLAPILSPSMQTSSVAAVTSLHS